jgi:dolichol-phosphate mannosyltransferase
MPIRVSVIAPLFNEEQGIPRLAETLAKLRDQLRPKYELECVLVDDGSRDQTSEVVERCFRNTPHIVKVAHDCNRGLGAAMRTGFRNATGSIVCTIDADCTFNPLELPKLLTAMEEGNADIATGSPYHPQGGVENVVPWRLFLSQGASKIYRVICRGKLYSYTSIMRAYQRDVVERISFASDGFVAVTEILLRALNEGYKVVEVPMVLRRRATGVSKMNVGRNILAHLVLASRVLLWRFLPPGPPASGLHPKQNVNP